MSNDALVSVPEYAIFDPRSCSLDHDRLHSPGRYDGPQTLGEAEVVRFACLPNIALPVGARRATPSVAALRAARSP
ncbi:MAG: hypothetical protein OHK0015_30580 [Chloroflexi bacterium OHK40]